jgi:site-specific recombinase XerD|tara:strand:+ start:28728 stop:29948 length:1221 start_codon:yes stop_codon:yes gene_type:complete
MPRIRFNIVPLFDSLKYIEEQLPAEQLDQTQKNEFLLAKKFLCAYTGSIGTFNAYRREIERLLHWSWSVAEMPIKELKRENIEKYIKFCQKPPKSWIGIKKPPRFINKDGERLPNPNWRPFVATVSKTAFRKGAQPDINEFEFTPSSVKELFAIISSFFNYLIQEEYLTMNPAALIRQKSKFIQKDQGEVKIRRLSELQWDYVIQMAEAMADQDPEQYERTLFIMSILYSMYLRISELVASERWTPTMNDFYRDSDKNWWFTTVGKGNKKRNIAVSDSMLKALKRWRQHLNLSALPTPADKSPLLPKAKGKGPMSSSNHIRRIVQECFDNAIEELHEDGHKEDSEALMAASVHWLRHTGISDDVKIRPREHVRDDAGHSSSAITDKYIDIDKRERHRSAKNKLINE